MSMEKKQEKEIVNQIFVEQTKKLKYVKKILLQIQLDIVSHMVIVGKLSNQSNQSNPSLTHRQVTQKNLKREMLGMNDFRN